MVWEWVTIQGAKFEGLTADELEWLFSCHLFADRILFRLSGFVLALAETADRTAGRRAGER